MKLVGASNGFITIGIRPGGDVRRDHRGGVIRLHSDHRRKIFWWTVSLTGRWPRLLTPGAVIAHIYMMIPIVIGIGAVGQRRHRLG